MYSMLSYAQHYSRGLEGEGDGQLMEASCRSVKISDPAIKTKPAIVIVIVV